LLDKEKALEKLRVVFEENLETIPSSIAIAKSSTMTETSMVSSHCLAPYKEPFHKFEIIQEK